MKSLGKLVAVLGSTGSGKSVLIEHIRNLYPEINAPVSYTTRAMRPGEVDGKHYHFVSKEEFEHRVAQGDFIEWVEFAGNYYGSRKSDIFPHIEAGELVLDEFDLDGIRAYKKILPPGQFVSIFIDGGSWEELEHRVRARAPIAENELEKRKKRYEDELSFKPEATYIIQNPEGKLNEAKKQFEDIINSLT
ncbi:ATP-binding cassette domain-containing protein [Candidatus Kaiserbacteria bacterium]|nr:ATP-binding cassette domain-containing protein [Candidatus Kaiserbacteria bacterium]